MLEISELLFYVFMYSMMLFRACAEEALLMLQGTQLGGQNIRLSWGRSPTNKQVKCYLPPSMLVSFGFGESYRF